MRTTSAVLAFLGLVLAACASGEPGGSEPAAPAHRDRPVAHTALLRDGGAVHGRIDGGEVRIRTQFGDLAFDAARVALVDVSVRGVGDDVVVTTEGDRFVGAVDWDAFAIDDGATRRALRAADCTAVRIDDVPDFDAAPVHVVVAPNEDLLVAGSLTGHLALLSAPGSRRVLDATGWRAWSVFDDVRRVRLGASREIGYHSDGLRITGVVPGSPAERAGWQAGDVLATLEGKPVRSNADVIARRDSILSGVAVYALVGLRRGDATLSFLIER